MKYFISPDPEILRSLPSDNMRDWLDEFKARYPEATKRLKQSAETGYSEYNYSGRDMVANIKLHHMEVALKATTHLFHKANAIDMGCADGIFMPSLSKYFNKAVGIDVNPKFLDFARQLCEKQGLNNVQLEFNTDDVGQKIGNDFQVLYCLEVLEHIGTSGATMYDEKVEFTRNALSLLQPGGIMVITVPKMVGLSYLVQRMGLSILGIIRAPITFGNLMRAAFLCKTDRMEADWWANGHLGFNHRKLQRKLYENFKVVKKKSLTFQVLYILQAGN